MFGKNSLEPTSIVFKLIWMAHMESRDRGLLSTLPTDQQDTI